MSPLQGLAEFCRLTQGVAQGWHVAGPLALHDRSASSVRLADGGPPSVAAPMKQSFADKDVTKLELGNEGLGVAAFVIGVMRGRLCLGDGVNVGICVDRHRARKGQTNST